MGADFHFNPPNEHQVKAATKASWTYARAMKECPTQGCLDGDCDGSLHDKERCRVTRKEWFKWCVAADNVR